MSETQGGSCEPCKRKKCKCDRRIPICGQCTSSPQLCKYAENNKRGIPGGYLSALEQRLNETEIALYNALSELRKIKSESAFTNNPDFSEPLQSRQANANKYSRMAEWVRLPLNSSEEIETWWDSVETPKLLEEPIEDQSDIDAMLHNEQTSIGLSNFGTLQYHHLEQSRTRPSNYERSPDTVSFDLPDQDTIPNFQSRLQPQVSVPERNFNIQGLPMTGSIEAESPRHTGGTYDIPSLRNQSSPWNGARRGGVGGLNRESTAETNTEMNRSKELSARMSHKYY